MTTFQKDDEMDELRAAAESGEGKPLRPLGRRRINGGETKQGRRGSDTQWFGYRYRDREFLEVERGVGAGSTVRVQGACLGLGRLFKGAQAFLNGIVKRSVVAEMLCGAAGFVLAVLGHDAPAKLKHHDC